MPDGCKVLFLGENNEWRECHSDDVNQGIAPANYVPAAAVTRKGQALFGFIGRKGRVGGNISLVLNTPAQPGRCAGNCIT